MSKKHKVVASALLAFVIVTGYKVSTIFSALANYEGVWNQPKILGDLIQACVFGLIAVAFAIGLDPLKFVRGLPGLSALAPPPPPPGDSQKEE